MDPRPYTTGKPECDMPTCIRKSEAVNGSPLYSQRYHNIILIFTNNPVELDRLKLGFGPDPPASAPEAETLFPFVRLQQSSALQIITHTQQRPVRTNNGFETEN